MRLPIERYQLDAGGVLLVSPKPESPCVFVHGDIPAGAVCEPDTLPGLADFTSRLLMGGTAERSHQQIAEELEAVGASIGFGSSVDAISFWGNSLPEHLGLVAGNIADCLEHAAFPPEQVEKVRGQMMTGLKQRRDDTRSMAGDAARELAYPGGHPYRQNGLPTEEALEKTARDDIAAFRDAMFGPKGMILAVSGNVSPAQAREQVETAFGQWQCEPDAPPAIPTPPSLSSAQRSVVPMMHKSQADIAIAFLAIRRADPQYYALSQANLVFGRLGLMGRLGKHVRDELGLAYYCLSDLEDRTGVGLWSVRAGVNPASVDRAIEATMQEIDRIASEPVSDDEISDAQQNQIGSLALRLETTRGVASAIHYIEYHGLGLDYIDRFPHLVRSVTKEQILQGAQRYLNPRVSVTTIAGPYQG